MIRIVIVLYTIINIIVIKVVSLCSTLTMFIISSITIGGDSCNPRVSMFTHVPSIHQKLYHCGSKPD